MNIEFREYIYNLVCGNYELSNAQIPESDIVQNEFADGSDCANNYNKMLDAYSRICARLGTAEWDDPDVEIIINALMDIGRHTSLKMFDYGLFYGSSR